jgi:uncharacterized protein (DUF697 family)
MNVQRWVGAAGAVWRALNGDAEPRPGYGAVADEFGRPGRGYGLGETLWRGLTGRSLEMAQVQEEVATEERGHVVVIGRSDQANRGLLARLRQQPPVPPPNGDLRPAGAVCREGFFTLVALSTMEKARNGYEPGTGYSFGSAGSWQFEELLSLLAGADLLLYVFEQAVGWQAADAHWYARLRVTGVPAVVVATSSAPAAPQAWGEQGGQVGGEAPPGVRPVTVQLGGGEEAAVAPAADVVALVERMLSARPRLAIPLAQEVPGCRPMIGRRLIRSGMVMTALLGAEPIPLLDLSLQVALNWKVALQLAAVYGQPGLDYRSREMIGTVALNLGLRYLIQQGAKLVPVLGWLVSAGLSGLGTWLLGHALLRYYEGEPLLPIADGKWQIANGKWQIANGKWQEARGRWQGAREKLGLGSRWLSLRRRVKM